MLGGVGHSGRGEAARRDSETRDGVDLPLRVGLNSGQVIAGEIGSGALGYTAIGEQVGMAQRMESVAPPGGVMLSESTARLVEHAAVLGEPELVHYQGQRRAGDGESPADCRATTTLIGSVAADFGGTHLGTAHDHRHVGRAISGPGASST